LHLDNNNIGSKGAIALGVMLLNKYKLSKLHINNNPIGDEGFHKIAVGIQKIETLRIITIANTGISHVSMDSLSKSGVKEPKCSVKGSDPTRL